MDIFASVQPSISQHRIIDLEQTDNSILYINRHEEMQEILGKRMDNCSKDGAVYKFIINS